MTLRQYVKMLNEFMETRIGVAELEVQANLPTLEFHVRFEDEPVQLREEGPVHVHDRACTGEWVVVLHKRLEEP